MEKIIRTGVVYVSREQFEELNEIVRLFRENEHKAEVNKFSEPINRLYQLMHNADIEDFGSELRRFIEFYFQKRRLFFDYWEFCSDVENNIKVKENE